MSNLRSGLNHAAVTDQALFQLGPKDARCGQEAHARIDDPFLTMKVKRGMVARQSQVRFVIRLDGSQVFPVAVEEMGMNPVSADAAGKDLPAEIRGPRRLVQKLEKCLSVEHVNAHARKILSAGVLD